MIGNPPYGEIANEIDTEELKRKYIFQDYIADNYLLFLEMYRSILHEGSYLGVIVSNTWLQSITLRKIRTYLTNNYRWNSLLHIPVKIFDAVVDTHVIIFQKQKDGIKPEDRISIEYLENISPIFHHSILGSYVEKNGEPINIVADEGKRLLFERIKKVSKPLSDFFSVFNGIKPFEVGKGDPPQTRKIAKDQPYVVSGSRPDANWSPLLRGSLIQRYKNKWNNDYWVKYGKWLAAPRDPKIFEAPSKIIVRQTGDSIIATLVGSGFIARNNTHIILLTFGNIRLEFLLGVMNSKLMDFAYSFMNPEKGEALAEVKKKHVEQLPIRTIDMSNPVDVKCHDRMVALVQRMLDLHKQTPATPFEQERLARDISATDAEIDRLVYELYELTPEEVKIVEG